MDAKFLNCKEIENLSEHEKIHYFSVLNKDCADSRLKKENKIYGICKLINGMASRIRNYNFELRGAENIPKDGRCLFLCNHSNAHDFLTMQEAFSKTESDITFLASNEDISKIIQSIFIFCGGVLIDRKEKSSINKGTLEFVTNIINGKSGVIFGESTWNLHPYKPMLPIKAGAANIAAITEVPIIPTIFEYVEIPEICYKEKEIYSKCIVKFAKPIPILRSESLITQTDMLQSAMEQNRIELWKELGIKKHSFKRVEQEIYLNHTYLKKFGFSGVEYDSEREIKFLLSKECQLIENEYHFDEGENFVPGNIQKFEKEKYVKK